MEADKPDNQEGCQLSYDQLASCLKQHEVMIQKAFLHIDKLQKEVDAIKRERDYFKNVAIRLLSGKPVNNNSPTEVEWQQNCLPKQLNTEKAHFLWRKLKAANLIDDHFQPLVSTAKAAMIADAMGRYLHINTRCRWKAFQLLWQHQYMSNDLIRAQRSDFYYTFYKEIESILGTEDQYALL